MTKPLFNGLKKALIKNGDVKNTIVVRQFESSITEETGEIQEAKIKDAPVETLFSRVNSQSTTHFNLYMREGVGQTEHVREQCYLSADFVASLAIFAGFWYGHGELCALVRLACFLYRPTVGFAYPF